MEEVKVDQQGEKAVLLFVVESIDIT